MADKETLRDLISEAKQKRSLKYKRFAERIGTEPQNITNFMRGKTGKPNWVEDLDKMAGVLGVSLDRLQAAVENTFANVSDALPAKTTRRRVPMYEFVPANRLGGPDDFYSEQQDYDPKMIEVEVTSDRCMVIVLDGDFYFIRTRGEDNGRCTFKQYVGKDRSGRHQFRCLNPKYGGVIRFKGEFDAARAMHRIL